MHIYNCVKDLHDSRDLMTLFSGEDAPEEIDLRGQMPPVFDQGNLGSCTANAIAGAFEFDEVKDKAPEFMCPSRLFIYYNERNMEGTVDKDAGASLRDGIKTVAKLGTCSEKMWPYDISKFEERPPQNCFEDAKNHKILKYSKLLQTISQIKCCLAKGVPFIFGIRVYESFNTEETSQTGIIPMPDTSTEQLLGGHALVCVGFNNKTRHFIFRNSWGESWGDKGYGYIPYDYLTNEELSSDFWIIKEVLSIENANVRNNFQYFNGFCVTA